jgi:geranylgeranyl reductase family protein
MLTIKTDVCIAGAGPAGATTSLFLSKMKIAHVILDAATFPRDKVCGDALDLKAIRILNDLEPGLVEREILTNKNFAQSKGVVINISQTKQARLIYTPKKNEPDFPYFIVSKRKYFDNFLVSKIDTAYASFLQATKVEKIIFEENEKIIFAKNNSGKIEIRAKLIVGADGDHSVVLKSLGERGISRENYAGGVRQYWKGISNILQDNCVELYLPKSLPLAYLWIFPLPNGEANVGCGLLSTLISERSVNLKELLHDIITKDPVMKDRFKNAEPLEKPVGWGLPLASLQRKASGNGWLLAGDAASLICPTTGEGIGPAMRSGYIAAHFIQRAVQTNNFSETFKNYDREIYKDLQGDIKIFNRIKNLFPLLYNFFINVVSSSALCRYYFKKNLVKWISTAYKSDPVKVNID